MDSLQTHPSTAVQAKAFTAPGSLSFPGGAGDLTPPSEVDKQGYKAGVTGQMNGGAQQGQAINGNGVTPATPAATPGATQGVSGIVPTLQYVFTLQLLLAYMRLILLVKKYRCHGQSRLPFGPQDDRLACEKR